MNNLVKCFWFALPVLFSCGPETAQETDWEEQEVLDKYVPEFELDGEVGSGPGAGTLSGTWLMVHNGSKCVLGAEQVTRAAYKVEIDQKGAVLTEKRSICSIELSKVLALQLRVPEATRDSIQFIPVDFGQITDLRVGGSYASAMEVALWGLELDDPLLDKVPEDADAPQVKDLDGDGNPAITFEVVGSECERYQGQRQIIRYFGNLVQPNDIIGRSINHTDIEVYGSSLQLCGIAPTVKANDQFSHFRMVRVDGAGGAVNADLDDDGEISCEELTPLRDQVLEARETDNENCK